MDIAQRKSAANTKTANNLARQAKNALAAERSAIKAQTNGNAA